MIFYLILNKLMETNIYTILICLLIYAILFLNNTFKYKNEILLGLILIDCALLFYNNKIKNKETFANNNNKIDVADLEQSDNTKQQQINNTNDDAATDLEQSDNTDQEQSDNTKQKQSNNDEIINMDTDFDISVITDENIGIDPQSNNFDVDKISNMCKRKIELDVNRYNYSDNLKIMTERHKFVEPKIIFR